MSFVSSSSVPDLHALLTTMKGPVVSVYLRIDPKRSTIRARQTALTTVAASIKSQLSKLPAPQRSQLEKGWKKLERSFGSMKLSAGMRSIVGFIEGNGNTSVWPVSVPLFSRAFLSDRPVVGPLARMRDDYRRYAVVLIDRDEAHVYTMREGALEDVSQSISSNVPKKIKGMSASWGGWQENNILRHIEWHLHEHFKKTTELLTHLQYDHAYDRLLIGGHPETLGKFSSYLPRALSDLVVGMFRVPDKASFAEIRKLTGHAIENAEMEEEDRMVASVKEENHKGGHAAVGLDRVLEALAIGAVHTLVIAYDFNVPIWVCEEHQTRSSYARTCDAGDHAMVKVVEGGERLIVDTLLEGGSVEFVRGGTVLDKMGGVAALLRFSVG